MPKCRWAVALACVLAAYFGAADKARLARIGELLETLALLGQVRAVEAKFTAA